MQSYVIDPHQNPRVSYFKILVLYNLYPSAINSNLKMEEF